MKTDHSRFIVDSALMVFTVDFKNQRQKRLTTRVMAKKMYIGNPFFKIIFSRNKTFCLYVLATFNVSVYCPYHVLRLLELIDLPGRNNVTGEHLRQQMDDMDS